MILTSSDLSSNENGTVIAWPFFASRSARLRRREADDSKIKTQRR